jgi:two-component system, LytTR family, response regulator
LTGIKKIKCIVIDDEDAAIQVLEHFIAQVPWLQFAGGYTSPVAALQVIEQGNIDLAFVDVQMPEISGLDLIKNIGNKCKVILTTAYSQYALDGYDLNVVDYLLKPVSLSRFLKAVEKVRVLSKPVHSNNTLSETEPEEDFILVKAEAKGKFFKIQISDIDYIEGLKNYISIVCGQKKIVSLLNLTGLEARLPSHKFVRVHKSFIVAVAKIISIEGNIIRLKDHPQPGIIIGDTYKQSFLEKMKTRLIE